MKQDDTQQTYLSQKNTSFSNATNLNTSAGGDAVSMMPPTLQFSSSEKEEGEKEDTEKERNHTEGFRLETDASAEQPPEDGTPPLEAFKLNDGTDDATNAEEGNNNGSPASPNAPNGLADEEKPNGAFSLNPNTSAEAAPATEQKAFVLNPEANKSADTSNPTTGDVKAFTLSEGNKGSTKGPGAKPIKSNLDPSSDPKFTALQENVTKTSDGLGEHPEGEGVAKNAQKSALVPSNEKQGKAQNVQVGEMDRQEPKEFDGEAFKQTLLSAIARAMPKDEEDADEFSKDNRLEGVKQQASNKVDTEKQKAGGDIEQTSAAEPRTDAISDREIEKLKPVEVGETPQEINTENAAPPKREEAEISTPLQEETLGLDQQMADAKITDETLQNSNEPTYIEAVGAKNEAKENAKTAPQEFRKEEDSKRNALTKNAKGEVTGGISHLFNFRKNALGKVGESQDGTMSKDEQKRKEIYDKVNGIYESTKSDVDGILASLDQTVSSKFDAGASAAKSTFEHFVAAKMEAYKEERYGGSWYSWKNVRRVGDAIAGLPDEVNVFYQEGKEVFLKSMDTVLTEISNLVAAELSKAKNRISTGKQQVTTYIQGLSPELQKIGNEASSAIQSKFDELDQSVGDKKDELIQSITNKYVENVDAIDARIAEMKLANSGLVNRAFQLLAGPIAFIKGVWDTLTGLLSTITQVIGDIISAPIEFASNLFSGIAQGFTNFGSNIVTHLQTGMIGWLTGALGPMGIEIPDDIFSIKGIFSLVTQVMGVTWSFMREKAVKLLGENTVSMMESGFELFQIARKDGIMGLWEHLKEEFNDLKETVMGSIREMLVTQVLQAGIKWVLSLLNPASAFVKAILMIIDVVKFFMERGSQIVEMVSAFIEGVQAVASGSVGKVASAIENALGKALPVIIGFLASILGISGLASKVTKIIQKIKKRIDDAIEKLILKAKAMFAKLMKKGKGMLGIKDGDEDDEEGKEDKGTLLNKGMEAGAAVVKNEDLTQEQVKIELDKLELKYKLDDLRIKLLEETAEWHSFVLEGHLDDESKKQTIKRKPTKAENEEEVSEADRKKHEEIAKVVEKKLKTVASSENIVTFEEFHAALKVEAKKLIEIYQPQLREGINITVDLVNSVEKDKKDDDAEIKIRIAPNTFTLETEIAFKDEQNKECRVDTIKEIDNKPENDEELKRFIGAWKKALKIREGVENISDDNRKLIKSIRGQDNLWKPEQGYIYVPWIEEQREAVQKLSQEAQGSIAILGIERGGAMVAEQISHDNKIIIEHQFVQEGGEEKRKKSLEVGKLLEELKKIAYENRDKNITVSIAETVVGGGSALSLINSLNASKIIEEYPNLTVKLLLLQQTMHSTENAKNAEAKIAGKVDPDYADIDRRKGILKKYQTPTGRVQVILSRTSYILGEDVDYQLNKKGGDSKKPVLLFNINDSGLILKKITPQKETRARDIVLMLSKGELDIYIKDMK